MKLWIYQFCSDRVIEMSVFDFKQKMPIMDLKSSLYKVGAETLESTLV